MVDERSMRERAVRSWILATALSCACAPSDFDEVVQESHDPDVCDAGVPEIDGAVCREREEADAGAGSRDGGGDGGPGQERDARDGAPGGDSGSFDGDRDAGASDARPHEARDAAHAADEDADVADAGCSGCAPDAAPPACGGQPAACVPGKMETQTEACGACGSGSRRRTRSCAESTCSWGEWSAWGACSGVTAACSPGESMGCSPADACGHRVCQDDCTWSACVPIMPDGCLRRRNGTQEDGSNFRCCGAAAWQFCLPSCEWSTDCAACGDSCSEC